MNSPAKNKNQIQNQQHYKSCIPLDLLEGSNIPMSENHQSSMQGVGANSCITTFTQNSSTSPKSSHINVMKHPDQDDISSSLSSVSSASNRGSFRGSPKSRHHGKEDFRIQHFPTSKDHINEDSKTIKRKGSNRDNNGAQSNYPGTSIKAFNKQESTLEAPSKYRGKYYESFYSLTLSIA